MSKKKKFAGKKTKLAEHALTQVLEQERAAAAEPLDPPSSTRTLAQAVQALRNDQLNLDLPTSGRHAIPTQRQLEITNGYLNLLQELDEMREMLRSPTMPTRPRTLGGQLWSLPNPEIIRYSLQIINHTLQEIKTFLG